MAVQISGDTGNVLATKGTYTGNLTVGGVLTYEDVTNVDSVGLVTARSGIEIGARPGVGASISVDGNAIFSGITTATTIKSNTGIVTTLTSTTFNVDGGDATFKGTTSGRDVIFDTSLNQIRAQDNAKLCAGSSSDLEIYHTGSASYIDNYTGAVYLRNNVSSDVNGDIYIQAKSGENSVVCYDDGAVELYYDSVKTFETKDIGAIVYNNTGSGNRVFDIKNPSNDYAFISLNDQNTTDNSKVRIGALANEMLIYAGGSEMIRLSDDGKIGFNNTDPSAAIELSFDSGGSAPSSGTAPEGIAISYGTADGKNGGIWFSPGFGDAQGISGICGTRVSGYQTDLRFYTNVTGSARAFTERMRIKENGNVMIGNPSHFTSNVAKLDVVHPGANTAPTYVSRFFQETNNQGTDHACIQLRHSAATTGSTGVMIDFKNTGGNSHGSIKMAETSVSFNTSSDYRLKENVTEISDGITRLKTLKPYRFNWKADASTTVDGFFAHEVTAVPEAITGTKDEVDSDNNPVYQGIDQSKLVPLLTAALQEAVTKIEVLETRLNNAGIAT